MMNEAASPLVASGELLPLALLGLLDREAGADRDDIAAWQAGLGVEVEKGRVDTALAGLARDGLIARDGERWQVTPAGQAAHRRGVEGVVALLGLPDPAALEAERETTERLRTDLLSTVSHELRTPLTLIRTSIGLLTEGVPDEPMRQRLLRNIKQSTDRMHALVADLLDLVRLRQDRAELSLRAVDLDELVGGTTALMRPLLEEKAQELVVEVPRPAPVVTGDLRRLERVLLNLLSNANAFSPAGATITVRVREAPEAVTITVADTGPGIAPEAQAQLFEQFYTARTSSSSHNIGVGLGLPIAKGIVEAHGGEITVESAPGEGSAFHVTLPRDLPLDEDGDEAARR
jgi:signal transduction histidine kinase